MTDPHDDRSPNGRDNRDGEIVSQSVHDRTSGEPLSSTVLNTIAGVEDADPEELPPFYESIDLDALDELFSPTASEGCRADGLVSFPFEDYHVTIHTHGEIAVVSISESRRSLSITGGGGVDIDSFRFALKKLIRTAAQNGVPVSGGWEVQTSSEEQPDWEVHISEVVRRSDADDDRDD